MINAINKMPLLQVEQLYHLGETSLKTKIHLIIHMNFDYLFIAISWYKSI